MDGGHKGQSRNEYKDNLSDDPEWPALNRECRGIKQLIITSKYSLLALDFNEKIPYLS
jgi:hypothetical protein